MTTDEKIADLQARIEKMETLLGKVIKLAMANPFARKYIQKVMED